MSSASCSPGCDDFGGIHSLNRERREFHHRGRLRRPQDPQAGEPCSPGARSSLKAGQWDEQTLVNWNLSETVLDAGQTHRSTATESSSTRTSRPTSSPRPRAPPRASTWTSRRVSSSSRPRCRGRTAHGGRRQVARLLPGGLRAAGDGYFPDCSTARVEPAARKAPEAPCRRQVGQELPPGRGEAPAAGQFAPASTAPATRATVSALARAASAWRAPG